MPGYFFRRIKLFMRFASSSWRYITFCWSNRFLWRIDEAESLLISISLQERFVRFRSRYRVFFILILILRVFFFFSLEIFSLIIFQNSSKLCLIFIMRKLIFFSESWLFYLILLPSHISFSLARVANNFIIC